MAPFNLEQKTPKLREISGAKMGEILATLTVRPLYLCRQMFRNALPSNNLGWEACETRRARRNIKSPEVNYCEL
jgi:hypothetical protein